MKQMLPQNVKAFSNWSPVKEGCYVLNKCKLKKFTLWHLSNPWYAILAENTLSVKCCICFSEF